MANRQVPGRSPERAAAVGAAVNEGRRRVRRTIERLARRPWVFRLDPWVERWTRLLEVPADDGRERFIVVLGGGIRSTGQLSETTVARVREGARLFLMGRGDRLVVSGGRVLPHRPVAAPAMARLAVALGVPAERIVLEDRSTRTVENAREVAALLRAHGESSAVLVTSAVHMWRAQRCFLRCGIRVRPAPVAAVAITDPRLRRSRLEPVLHELVGLTWYRLRRWI